MVFRKKNGRRKKAASIIQKAFRRRRAKAKIGRAMKKFAVKKINRSTSEVLYKSYTIIAPDAMFISAPPVQYQGAGLTGADPLTNQYRNCFELGMFLKVPSDPNGLRIFSPELKNQLETFRQARVVHGSVTMLRFCDSNNDGNPATGTAPTSTIGFTGTKEWISYVSSVIDNGSFKDANNLQNLSISPVSNLASSNEDEYLSNSNARLTQMSHDSKKSFKTKILNATAQSEFAQQRYGIYNNATPPVQQLSLKCNSPWLDTKTLVAVGSNGFLAGNPNYANVYALTRLPPLSVYGQNFPVTTSTTAGNPVRTSTPLHKVLISICVAFRIPTTRV